MYQIILNLNLNCWHKNMKSKRSALSMSIQEDNQQKTFDQNQFVSETERNFNQIFDDIKMIKKQLKQRVTRNQFISSLSSKLSISELASINFAHQKENITPNTTNNNQQTVAVEKQVKKLSSQIAKLKAQFSIQDFEKLKQNWGQLHSKVIYHQRKVERMEQEIEQREENEKKRLAEVQAYIYRKAERSEIEKLFTLNQLLVIQIQQAKQKVEQSSKVANIKIKEIYDWLKSQICNWQKQQEYLSAVVKETDHRVCSEQRQMSQQIEKILQILEQKQNVKQQNQEIYNINLTQMHNRLKVLQSEQNLYLKQLTTRVNVLELKEGQIHRSVREVDQMKSQIQSFKVDIINLHEKSSEVSVNVKQFCELTANSIKNELLQKMAQQVGTACEQIIKKVFSLTSQMLSMDEFDSLIAPIKDKQRHLIVSESENNRKIDFLEKKQRQIQEIVEEEIEKSQERTNVIQKQFSNYVSTHQIDDLIKKCVKIEELKELGKHIDIKMDSQIKAVVEQQDKINQVICAQNIMAKWFWNSAALKGGNLVSWDRQVVNTLPQNFKWQKNEPTVIIRKGGYYRIQMGFYSKKKPTVQLIVNGQTIVSAVNTSSYVLHHSSGKLKDVSNSQISGLTYVDYLLLPDEARIAISYIGDFTGEGFLAIHRV